MHFSDRVVQVKLDNRRWLLFSTLSGAMDIVAKDLINHLREERWNAISHEMRTVLLERGYLFESRRKEKAEFLFQVFLITNKLT